MAKDILRFHCVYWPAMLLSAGYEVPKQIFVHGYLLLDERKISKSLGNVIDPLDLVDVYGADAVRFWAPLGLVRPRRDGLDRGLHERYERELGNELGNLLSRTTAMIARYRRRPVSARTRSEVDAPRDRRAGRGVARADRRLGPDRRARADLAARPPAQRDVERDEAVGARQGRGERGRARRVLYDLADGLRVSPSRSPPRPGDVAGDPRALGQPTTSVGGRRVPARPAPMTGSSRRRRSSRASTRPAAA